MVDVTPVNKYIDAHGCIALGERWIAYPTCDSSVRDTTSAPFVDPMQTMVHLAQQTGKQLYYYGDKGYRTVTEFVSGRGAIHRNTSTSDNTGTTEVSMPVH